MKPLTTVEGLVAPINRSNVDTDALIPKQFMKSIKRSGFGQYLFDEWRYLDKGYPGKPAHERQPNPDFVLNMARYQGASILVAQDNFGCGSSREHAVWALDDFGIQVVIAPSFAEIFYANCFKNGILPIVLPALQVEEMISQTQAEPGFRLQVDLVAQSITRPDGSELTFEIDRFYKHRLVNGLDDIGITLGKLDKIRAYEVERKKLEPWLFRDTA